MPNVSPSHYKCIHECPHQCLHTHVQILQNTHAVNFLRENENGIWSYKKIILIFIYITDVLPMSGTESEPETKSHRKPLTGSKMDPQLARKLILPTWL